MGWLAGQIYAGVSSPTYGTLTFGRQNSLLLDGVIAYDPMGASYAFSPIGFSGLTCGAGDAEACRFTTAIKYRVNIGDFHLGLIGQVATYAQYNPSNGAIEGELGGDIHNLGPGILSLDAIGAFVKDAANISPVFLPATISPRPPAFAFASKKTNASSFRQAPGDVFGWRPWRFGKWRSNRRDEHPLVSNVPWPCREHFASNWWPRATLE